jgi:hypothetical protein
MRSLLNWWQTLKQMRASVALQLDTALNSTPLNATTPQGAQLLARGDVRFADGRVTSMFEAIFNANDVDTKYAGEAGPRVSHRSAVAANDNERNAWLERPFRFAVAHRTVDDKERYTLNKMGHAA